MQHQREADGGDRRDRDARHAGGDRRVEHGKADERAEEDEPAGRHVAVAHVPAVEIEIGEQEDEQGGAEHRLGAGAVDAVGPRGDREDALDEAEIDARIGEHRPGQRRRRREDDRALDHEHDGQEEREQARYADDDALVEGEAVDLLLIGLRLPQIELRQVGRAQLRHERHRRAGVERDGEHVGVGAVLALGRVRPLARRDLDDARGAEIGPHDARADEPVIRRNEQPFDLLVGAVRQRKDDPAADAAAALARLDRHAPHDAVGTGRRGYLQHVAFRAVAFDDAGEIDGRGVERHPHRLHRPGLRQAGRDREAGDQCGDGAADEMQRVDLYV